MRDERQRHRELGVLSRQPHFQQETYVTNGATRASRSHSLRDIRGWNSNASSGDSRPPVQGQTHMI